MFKVSASQIRITIPQKLIAQTFNLINCTYNAQCPRGEKSVC